MYKKLFNDDNPDFYVESLIEIMAYEPPESFKIHKEEKYEDFFYISFNDKYDDFNEYRLFFIIDNLIIAGYYKRAT